MAMTYTTRQTLGFILAIAGLVLMLFSALDYVMGMHRIGPIFTVLGVALILTGAGLARSRRP